MGTIKGKIQFILKCSFFKFQAMTPNITVIGVHIMSIFSTISTNFDYI